MMVAAHSNDLAAAAMGLRTGAHRARRTNTARTPARAGADGPVDFAAKEFGAADLADTA